MYWSVLHPNTQDDTFSMSNGESPPAGEKNNGGCGFSGTTSPPKKNMEKVYYEKYVYI